VLIRHSIEAQNLQSLAFGTAGAQKTILSFWVKSNKTGNASFMILQPDNSNKLVSFQYSISSADTWEYKTITIPADTAGVINNDNGAGFQMEWWLHSGSTYTSGSLQSTWTTFNNADRNPSNLGVGSADNDYFQITGVQLEVGSKATPFEHRSYSDELHRCYRYYYRVTPGNGAFWGTGLQYSATQAIVFIPFPVPLRIKVSAVETTGTAADYKVIYGTNTVTCNSVPVYGGDANDFSQTVNFNVSSGTAGAVGDCVIGRSGSANAYLAWSAEL